MLLKSDQKQSIATISRQVKLDGHVYFPIKLEMNLITSTSQNNPAICPKDRINPPLSYQKLGAEVNLVCRMHHSGGLKAHLVHVPSGESRGQPNKKNSSAIGICLKTKLSYMNNPCRPELAKVT
jgi:hypothetical protein